MLCYHLLVQIQSPVSAVTSTTALLVPESGCHDMAVCWVVARGACVVVAAGRAMGVAVGLIVLIPVVFMRVPNSTVGTAIAAIVFSDVAATAGTAVLPEHGDRKSVVFRQYALTA